MCVKLVDMFYREENLRAEKYGSLFNLFLDPKLKKAVNIEQPSPMLTMQSIKNRLITEMVTLGKL